MRRGAERQADQGGRCLSEASLDRRRLTRAPQVARSEAKGRRHQGRLFLAYFLLAKQKKVSRPPRRQSGIRSHQTNLTRIRTKASTGSARTGWTGLLQYSPSQQKPVDPNNPQPHNNHQPGFFPAATYNSVTGTMRPCSGSIRSTFKPRRSMLSIRLRLLPLGLAGGGLFGAPGV